MSDLDEIMMRLLARKEEIQTSAQRARHLVQKSPTFFRLLRGLAGLTQLDVADALDVRQPTVAAYEAGTAAPTEHRAKEYVTWLLHKVDLDDVGGDIGEELRTMRAHFPPDPWRSCDERLERAREARGSK